MPEVGQPHLAYHLISKHADGMAVNRPLAANQEAHKHEHDGPGTIRNHDEDDLSWDADKAKAVLQELAASDEFFYNPDAILEQRDAYPIHKVIAGINIGVRDRGEIWAKCANCGEPYQLTKEWNSETVCSEGCASEYTSYLNNPGSW